MQSLLNAEALEVWRGESCLFESLDFALDAGQTALLVGANGAGKTTLLRVLAGLTPPTSGKISWLGTSVASLSTEQHADIAYRGHADGLKRELTVRENLDFCRQMWSAQQDVEELVAELRLDTKLDVQVRHLSAGQRRRVGFGCLRMAAARLWILDEPMTHLDSAGRALVSAWILEHVARGGVAIVATHQPDELARSGTLIIEL